MLLVTVSVLRVCLLVQATYFSYVVVVVVVPGQIFWTKNIQTTLYLATCLCLWKKQRWFLRCFAASRAKIVQKHRYLHCF